MTPLFAHAGHWLAQLVYLLPLLVIAWLFGASYLRQRREQKRRRDTSA